MTGRSFQSCLQRLAIVWSRVNCLRRCTHAPAWLGGRHFHNLKAGNSRNSQYSRMPAYIENFNKASCLSVCTHARTHARTHSFTHVFIHSPSLSRILYLALSHPRLFVLFIYISLCPSSRSVFCPSRPLNYSSYSLSFYLFLLVSSFSSSFTLTLAPLFPSCIKI